MKKIYNIVIKITIVALILVVLVSIIGNSKLMPVFEFISIKTAQLGTFFLYYLIISKSIYFILKKIKVSKDNKVLKFLQKNNKYQREEGLIIFNILFIHSYIETIKYFNTFSIEVFNYLTILVAVIILIYMEITSFKYFQRKMKNWKKSHTIVWIIVPLILLHIVIVADQFIKYIILTGIILIIALVESILNIKKGTKHLNYLLIGLIIALVEFKVVKGYESNIMILPTTNIEQVDNTTQENENNVETSSDKDTSIVDNTAQENENNVETSSDKDTSIVDNISTGDQEDITLEVDDLIYNDGTYEGEGRGHNGSIKINTTIENDDILDIEVISQREDDPWWEPVEATIIPQVIENDSIEDISYVAGSTHSSQGLLEAIESSLDNAKI